MPQDEVERRLSVLINSHPSQRGHVGPPWLRGIQTMLNDECEAVARAVVLVRDKLTEIERFAADDWQTTEAEFEKLAARLEARKVGGWVRASMRPGGVNAAVGRVRGSGGGRICCNLLWAAGVIKFSVHDSRVKKKKKDGIS